MHSGGGLMLIGISLAGVVLIIIAHRLWWKFGYLVSLACAKRFNRKLYDSYMHLMTTPPGKTRALTYNDILSLYRRGELKQLNEIPDDDILHYSCGTLFRGDFIMDRWQSETLFDHVCQVKFGGVIDPLEYESRDRVWMRKPDGEAVLLRNSVNDPVRGLNN